MFGHFVDIMEGRRGTENEQGGILLTGEPVMVANSRLIWTFVCFVTLIGSVSSQ